MISTLTDIGLKECLSRFGQPPAVKIYNDLVNMERVYQELVSGLDINQKPFDAVICSPLELDFLRKNLPRTIDLIVPGIRDEWMLKANEHQKRTTGVKWALDHGANYVVMGAQMTKGNPELAVSAEESRIRTFEEIKKAAPNLIVEGDPLATLRNCKGFYESRKNQADQYLGPLVTYAKKYQDAEKKDKNMVGFIYLNFAKAERYWKVRDWFAGLIDAALAPISENLRIDVVLGAPLGGMLFAGDVGRHLNCQTIFAEKIVTKAADKEKNEREISHLSLERHEINAGDRVAIVEDVTNNFSTTEEANALIENYGGKLVAIICPFNRSGKSDWNGIPVISACNTPLNQYRQDDPMVSELVDEGNIVMKPKLEWEKLEAAMEEKQIE
jgi:adenine/guanine phosphoribosyltransferase-like PRPP-binding protein